MKLENITLEDWLKKPPKESFLNQVEIDYYSKFKAIKDYLKDEVYPDVTSSANYLDDGMYYNDHGMKHIETVIERASQLVKSENCNLSVKEVYFLLCCILIHDVGMLYGRKNHEINSKTIMEHIQNIFSTDTTEKRVIYDIAKAHGGKTKNMDKDTIHELVDNPYLANEKMQIRLIAAILRFADELADDKDRASQQLLKDGLLYHRPSEVFHAYSSCLNSVIVQIPEKSVQLEFSIPLNFLNRTFGKYEEKVLLIDEIYLRLLKLYRENIYCQKYMGIQIPLNRILVNVQFIPPYQNPFDNIDNYPAKYSFTMSNNGYPEIPKNRIFEICPELIIDDKEKTVKDGIYFLEQFYNLTK